MTSRERIIFERGRRHEYPLAHTDGFKRGFVCGILVAITCAIFVLVTAWL